MKFTNPWLIHENIDPETRRKPQAFRHGDKSIGTLVALKRLIGFSHIQNCIE
ncbi:hypothetical protein [Sphaerospermopsis sp. FACHB-1194]|uniref:hypothetical protein n=1 Tax=Sphaerospermopsis sp. FACHB-1194 TaxID=2692862 RepID=UPI0016801381|nr:hypothetical protein [Sphaerospermopsis sp. FACHB-1194]MBD2148436.1 hypothetical protein [Sphaerospermopsis sp. FACHB-1194]